MTAGTLPSLRQIFPRNLLHRLREVALDDPAQEARLLARDVAQEAPPVLPEVDRGLAVDEADAPLGIDVLVETGAELLVELEDGPGELGVAFELTRQDPHRHLRVRERPVRARVVRLAVEARRGGQVPRLPREEDPLGVDDPTLRDLERHAGAEKLDAQNRKVEPGNVVAAEIGAVEEGGERRRDLAEARRGSDVRLANAVDRGRRGGDRHARVQPPDELLARPVGPDLDAGDLDDAVDARIRPGRLGVEDDQRPIEIERQQAREHVWKDPTRRGQMRSELTLSSFPRTGRRTALPPGSTTRADGTAPRSTRRSGRGPRAPSSRA